MDSVDKNRTALLSAISRDLSAWEDKPSLWLDPLVGPKSAAVSLLRSTLFKKWSATNERAETRALLTFLEANHLSESWELSPSLSGSPLWGEFCRELDNFFHDGPEPIVRSFNDLFVEGDTGPGSAVGASCTSFYGKFAGAPMSVGSLDLYFSCRRAMRQDTRWNSFLEEKMKSGRDIGLVTNCSKVSFAPKNVDTARLICVEPLLNMWCQKGLQARLESRLASRFHIWMDVQPDINRILARDGSIDGSFATLDLSSASDSISVKLCQHALPRWLFELIGLLRSGSVHCKEYGLVRSLGMISTMGNAFTFPLMTIILSCAIRAVYLCNGVRIKDNQRRKKDGKLVPGNWAVFGDDIIVVAELYDSVVAFLQLLGFQVNDTKSFKEGPFRESCGHDYYQGHNIRGVYLKRLTTRQDVTIAINRLNDWTYRTGIPLCHAVEILHRMLDKVFLVPYSDPDDAGIRVPSSLLPEPQRRNANGLMLYQRMVARPARVRIGDGVVKTPRGHKRIGFSGAIALLSLLKGELRNGQVSVRQTSNGGLYQTRRTVTPWWDYMCASAWVNPQSDWRRWNTAVNQNLILVDLKA